jgi:hypothetical protein
VVVNAEWRCLWGDRALSPGERINLKHHGLNRTPPQYTLAGVPADPLTTKGANIGALQSGKADVGILIKESKS